MFIVYKIVIISQISNINAKINFIYVGSEVMTLQQLSYYYYACMYKSITEAAKVLHVTQPTVTQAIKELERELGAILIIRSPRQFLLTREGEILLIKAKKVLSQIDDIINVFDDISQTEKTIRMGIPPMSGAYILPSIISAFHKLFPEIKFEIQDYGSYESVDKLKNNDLDVAIISHDAINYPFLSSTLIKQTELMYCVGCNHPLKDRNKIKISEMAKDKLVLFKEGYFLREQVLKGLISHNIKPEIFLCSNETSTIKGFVKANLASSFLLEETTHEEGIFPIHISPPIKNNIFIIWNNINPLDSHVKELIDFVGKMFSRV